MQWLFILRSLVLSLLLGLNLLSIPTYAADSPAIAAAANVRFALHAIAQQFTQETHLTIRPSYGSSGQLTQQILNGAPFEIFISADSHYPLLLEEAEKTQGRLVVYAIGRLAIIKSRDSNLLLDAKLQGLSQALTNNQIARFAIATPAHAPYGLRAKDALIQQQLWKPIENKLIYGENVAQAAQFALSNSAQGGIVALSLVKAPAFHEHGEFSIIDQGLHQPLLQSMVLTSTAGATAKHFFQYLQSDTARDIFVQYGFDLPRQD
ncbi:molybdate ABC transporter substrate-binding protein [Parashewanella spongiae]|uniref:Molybdate ABC transporter substrate-binding protein n=2 Tax=Parashewanella spongiae TaxID=342950 RepID=A0A3A6UDU8_9GAMM|nr:molybdate ABC transporter substrate-binding protein [Parashewanella spongiae]RJY16941.1 molybdate ABC transporter substrate-binding protein [Parashewanella spongiae]